MAENGKKRHGPRLGRLLRNIGSIEELTAIGGRGQPPNFAYDPQIEQERRAAARGLLDTKQDTALALRQGRQDLHTTLRDLAINLKRGKQDARIELRRGLEDIRFQRQDTRREGRRGIEDLNLQIGGLIRQSARTGEAQKQNANAAGVYDAGTLRAAAAKRAENLRFARQPLDISKERVREDVGLTLGRLGTQAQRLRRDTRIGVRRLKQDTRHDRRLARRDFGRTRRSLFNSLDRAAREQRIGNVDLLEQEIFDARQRHPGVYSRRGRKVN